jgi:hypothetical protein
MLTLLELQAIKWTLPDLVGVGWILVGVIAGIVAGVLLVRRRRA